MLPVYIAGCGMTEFGRRREGLVELMREAAARALRDSPVAEIDAIYVAAMNPEEFTGDGNLASGVLDALGLTGLPALRVETASSSGAAAFHAAFEAIASGHYRHVLVIGGKKMTHLSTSATTKILAEVIDAEERRCGATMPALAAMMTEKYRRKYRLTAARLEKLLCAVAMKNHLNGARNPYAQFRQPISREQYLASKFVATPLRLYDCAPITDGAAALILTAEATDLWVSGIGQGTAPLSMRERAEFTSFPATQIAARRAYAMAGARPESIDFAEVHDAFTAFEIIGTEDLGFFSPGEGGDAIEHGRTAVDGTLPINASGGLKARGHPVGASGIAQIVETARLLRGSADVELKREPRRGLSQSTGGLAANNFVTIVERRRDGTRVQNLWPGPLAVSQPAPIGPVPLENVINEEEEGKIETFTILHVTPDGFLPPLGLALIRGRRGSMIMGQAEHIDSLAIGKTVYLRKTAGIYTFTVKSHLQSVRAAFHRLFSGSRPGSAATASEEQSEKKHRSIARLVVEQLRSGILAGMLAPGQVIRADELAERLKLGRFALSNALRLLEAEGYVTFLADGEIAISSPKSREIEDYYAIAGVLEGLATRLAIERATNEETLRLRELHQALREAHRSGDAYAYFTANGKFHAFIVEMARNEPLARLIGEARHEIQKSSILALDLRERLDFSMREHDQILDTVLKRNRDLAQVIVSRHLENQMRALRQVLPPDPEVRHEGV